MASFYGEDASKSALESAYDKLMPTIAPAHKLRLDGEATRNIRMLPAYKKARLVLGYVSSREEFDVSAVVAQAKADGKEVALPTTSRDGIIEYALADGTPVSALDDELVAESICLVPGLVFDAEGYRIAYGAGYMDNFLATYPGMSVALVRSINISSNPLPHGDHDVPVDVLVSDSAVWMCRR